MKQNYYENIGKALKSGGEKWEIPVQAYSREDQARARAAAFNISKGLGFKVKTSFGGNCQLILEKKIREVKEDSTGYLASEKKNPKQSSVWTQLAHEPCMLVLNEMISEYEQERNRLQQELQSTESGLKALLTLKEKAPL